MTIYLDIIWLLNFCIDVMLVWMTALALKRPLIKWRIILAGFIASTIVLFLFTPLAFLFYQPWMKILFSMLIVLVAFGFKRLSYFIQNVCMFYFVTFMTGGGLFALHYFWQSEVEILNGVMFSKVTGFGSSFSWILVVVGFPLLWYFSKQQFHSMEARKINYENIVEVEVVLDDKKIVVKGLIDSGNQLKDPITRAPVMILEGAALQKVYPDLDIKQLTSIDCLGDEGSKQHPLLHRMRIIPYKVVGNNQDFLFAFKPDEVKIVEGENEHITKKVLVGIQHMTLSTDGDYQSIIHPKMLISGHSKKLA